MIDIVEKTLIKHRKAITPEIAESAKEGFRLINKGSEILYRVLEDPNVELPALEWTINLYHASYSSGNKPHIHMYNENELEKYIRSLSSI